MGNGLHVCRPVGCEATRAQPVWNSLLRQPRLAEMTGDQLGLAFAKLWKQCLDRCCNPRVQFLATSLQQALIGGVAHQRMLEDVGSSWRKTSPKDELCCQ